MYRYLRTVDILCMEQYVFSFLANRKSQEHAHMEVCTSVFLISTTQFYNLLYAQWFLMYEGKCWFMQHAPTYNMVSLEKSSTKVTDLLLFFSAGSEGTSNISRKGERPAMAEPQRLTFQKPYPTKRVYSTKNLWNPSVSSWTSWNIHPTFLLDGAFQRCLIFTPNLGEMIQFDFNLTNIVHMGWNHQLVLLFGNCFCGPSITLGSTHPTINFPKVPTASTGTNADMSGLDFFDLRDFPKPTSWRSLPHSQGFLLFLGSEFICIVCTWCGTIWYHDIIWCDIVFNWVHLIHVF